MFKPHKLLDRRKKTIVFNFLSFFNFLNYQNNIKI